MAAPPFCIEDPDLLVLRALSSHKDGETAHCLRDYIRRIHWVVWEEHETFLKVVQALITEGRVSTHYGERVGSNKEAPLFYKITELGSVRLFTVREEAGRPIHIGG